jgi:hypothetical protein
VQDEPLFDDAPGIGERGKPVLVQAQREHRSIPARVRGGEFAQLFAEARVVGAGTHVAHSAPAEARPAAGAPLATGHGLDGRNDGPCLLHLRR